MNCDEVEIYSHKRARTKDNTNSRLMIVADDHMVMVADADNGRNNWSGTVTNNKLMKNVELDFWPNGVRHCVTFSYDDARFEDYRLVELFNKYSLKATFHICCPEWKDRFEFLKRDGAKYVAIEDYAKLYEGHEMSCHLAHHPFVHKLPKESLATEVYRNKVFLESIAGYPVRGMSYPFGTFTEQAITTFESIWNMLAQSARTQALELTLNL